MGDHYVIHIDVNTNDRETVKRIRDVIETALQEAMVEELKFLTFDIEARTYQLLADLEVK